MLLEARCYCGASSEYKNCCLLFISQKQLPETAEQLMRSRYTAFKLKHFDYLIETHLSADDRPNLKTSDFDPNIEWLGLKILSSQTQNTENAQSLVEFVAFYRDQTTTKPNHFQQLHEKSYFEKNDDRWLYRSGTPLKDIKLSRNELCFCDSGKKYKKCHAV